MKKKILITGGRGFIGRNLTECLVKKYEMYNPDRKLLDLTDKDCLSEYLHIHNFDIIIHSANINSTRNKNVTDYDQLDGNLRMFYNLISERKHYGKMLYFGSGAEYDRLNYVPNMSEDYFGTYIPKDAYGFSKYIMSKTCEQESNIYDLRLFGVYGKYEEWERRFISNAICRVLKGKDITIEKNVCFDYLWVADLADIIDWFIEHTPVYRHYNVCRGSVIDLYSLAQMVKKELNSGCKIIIKEPGWKPEYSGNNQRLLREMGDYTFSGYEDTISKLCSYYYEHLNEIDESRLI